MGGNEANDDSYFASAIEFIYSQDSGEMAFGSMNRKEQERLLQQSWVQREKEFYGDDQNQVIDETPEMEEDAESSDDIDRGST